MTFEPYGVTSYTTFIHDPMESLASNLKEQGTGIAEAVHPFIKEDYKRDKVYKYFGFDSFYGMEDFGETSTTRSLRSMRSIERKVRNHTLCTT